MAEDERLIVRLDKAADLFRDADRPTDLFREAADEINRLENVIETMKIGLRVIAKGEGGAEQMKYEAAETMRVADRVAAGE